MVRTNLSEALERWRKSLDRCREARARALSLQREWARAVEEAAISCPEELLAHLAGLAKQVGLRPLKVQAVVNWFSGEPYLEVQVVVPADDVFERDFFDKWRSLVEAAHGGPLGPILKSHLIAVMVVGNDEGADFIGRVHKVLEGGRDE